MGAKDTRQSYARDQAAALTHIAMRLQRCKKGSVAGLLSQAQTCLDRYRTARVLVDVPVAPISDTVAGELEFALPALRDVIQETVAPMAYALLVFALDDQPGSNMCYVSNAELDPMCQAMAQFVTAHEAAKE